MASKYPQSLASNCDELNEFGQTAQKKISFFQNLIDNQHETPLKQQLPSSSLLLTFPIPTTTNNNDNDNNGSNNNNNNKNDDDCLHETTSPSDATSDVNFSPQQSELDSSFIDYSDDSFDDVSDDDYENIKRNNDVCKKDDDKHLDEAYKVALEIVSTEEKFIMGLRLINEDFQEYISRRLGETQYNITFIFQHLASLQKVHVELHRELKQRVNNWKNDPRIADIFIRIGPYLKLHANYIRNVSNRIEEFNNIRFHNLEFDQVVTEYENLMACNKIKFIDHMRKPVQRIPQYGLLLKEYLKKLKLDSPDYETTKKAISIVTSVAELVNESVRNWEDLEKILAIQKSMINECTIIKPGRRLLKEGQLLKFSYKEMQLRMFFLFNDMLLYATPCGKRYKDHKIIFLNKLEITYPEEDESETEFNIMTMENSFAVAASSKKERDEWVDAFEQAKKEYDEIIQDRNNILGVKQVLEQKKSIVNNLDIESLKSPSFGINNLKVSNSDDHSSPNLFRSSIIRDSSSSIGKSEVFFKIGEVAPVYMKENRISKCMICGKGFSVTSRKHHCRGCGKVLCNDCLDCRAPMKYKLNEGVRCCFNCFKVLWEDFQKTNKEYLFQLCRFFEKVDDLDVWGNLDDWDESGDLIKLFELQKLSECEDVSFEALCNIKGFKPAFLISEFRRKNNDMYGYLEFKEKYRTCETSEQKQKKTNSPQMKGNLYQLKNKKWKKLWIVLKGGVLYEYRTIQDKLEFHPIQLVNYEVKNSKFLDEDDDGLTFELTYQGVTEMTFKAESKELKKKWVNAFLEASLPKAESNTEQN